MDYNIYEFRQVGFEGISQMLWLKPNEYESDNTFDDILRDWNLYKEHFLKYVKKFNVVVQAGGCCGMYPLFYGNYFKNVYTFEPDFFNFRALWCNLKGNKFHIYHAALGNVETMIDMKQKMNGIGESYIDPKTIGKGLIKQVTIDMLDLNACDLIHLDCERYEPFIIVGAIKTIKKFSPVVITEKGSGWKELEKLGYRKKEELEMDTIFIKK